MLTQVEQIIYDEAVEWATEVITEAVTEKNIISVIQMCKDLGIEKITVLKQLSERFSISELKAQDYMEAHWI